MKTVDSIERLQWRRSDVFIVKCEHVSRFVLIDDFELENVVLVHIKNTNTSEGGIRYIMRYAAVFLV